MKKIVIPLILSILMQRTSNAQPGDLVPVPASTVWNSGKFRITDAFSASYNEPTLEGPVNQFFRNLNASTMAFFRNEYFRPGQQGQLQIQSGNRVEPLPGVDETYTIEVSAERISIRSANQVGSMRALETLLQLVNRDEQGYFIPAGKIQDGPAFPWRGLMVDVARHFIPMDVLKRNVDAMAAVKLNVLHLHLTDDEGFRMESKVYPRLHQLGSNGQYFTQEELKGLVRYARERGIAVVPEFDLPGHSRSWFAGYPELASTPGTYTPGPRMNTDGKSMGEIIAMMNTAPTPTIDPTRESVYQFIDKLMAEVKGIFPSAFFHLGADENNGVAWKQNKDIATFMEKNRIADAKALEHYFVMRVYKLTQKHKVRMIVWEEAFNKELPKDVIVQKWKPELALMGPVLSANTVLAQGNDLLTSAGFYLDHHMPAHIYHQNPSVTGLKGLDSLKGKMLGGEAAQWSEIVDGNTIETRMWINAAAVAERLWSNPKATDVPAMYSRLFRLGHTLDLRGLRHIDQYEKGLRALADSMPLADLRVLTDVLTPVRGYKRLFAQIGKPAGARHSMAPLNSIADILPINSEARWALRQQVEQYLAEPSARNRERINASLERYKNLKTLPWNPQLSAIRPHAENLGEMARVAQEAMQKRADGSLTEEWIQSKQDLFRKASAPASETTIDIVEELRALVTGKLAPIPASYPLF